MFERRSHSDACADTHPGTHADTHTHADGHTNSRPL